MGMTILQRGKNEVGRAVVNKSMAYSLAEFLPEVLPSSFWAVLSSQGKRAPPCGPLTIEVSGVILHFTLATFQ